VGGARLEGHSLRFEAPGGHGEGQEGRFGTPSLAPTSDGDYVEGVVFMISTEQAEKLDAWHGWVGALIMGEPTVGMGAVAAGASTAWVFVNSVPSSCRVANLGHCDHRARAWLTSKEPSCTPSRPLSQNLVMLCTPLHSLPPSPPLLVPTGSPPGSSPTR
jgi:hypothetical protein